MAKKRTQPKTELISIATAAERLDVSRQAVEYWISRGWIEVHPPAPPRVYGRRVDWREAKKLAEW